MTALLKLWHGRTSKNDIVMPLDGEKGKCDAGDPFTGTVCLFG